MHGAVAGVVVGEVQPLLVGADEAVRIVQRTLHEFAGILRVGAGFGDEDALVGPGLAVIETDPEGEGRTTFGVIVMQQGDGATAEREEGGFAAGGWGCR